MPRSLALKRFTLSAVTNKGVAAAPLSGKVSSMAREHMRGRASLLLGVLTGCLGRHGQHFDLLFSEQEAYVCRTRQV